MFGSLLVINYFCQLLIRLYFQYNTFYATRKIIQMLVSLLFLHTHKNKSIVNLYQKELLGFFSEDIKMWPSHNVLNWLTCNWLLYNIYVDSMGLYTNVNSVILSTLQ